MYRVAVAALMLSVSAGACTEGSVFRKLSALNGQSELGDCVVEVHVCESRDSAAALPTYLTEGPAEKSRFWVGDIYVKHVNGKSLYVPVFSPESNFPRTTVTLTETDKKITYQYRDKNYDPKSGLKEMYEFTIFKGRPRIELKMKTSKESRQRPIRSLFFPNLFIKCEEKITTKGN